MRGPLFRPNTFFVTRGGAEAVRITKRWSGVLREAFSRADTFHVESAPTGREPAFATLALATALALDLGFFEDRGRGSASSMTVGR